MPAYRFCRPDDIPLLVRALNSCFDVYFPDEPPTTVASFKHEMRTVQLWPSSCMIAMSGDEPIAIVAGCKHSGQTLIRKLGAHPEHLRKGHGRYLLTSLSSKLAVLGPPVLWVELPLTNAESEESLLPVRGDESGLPLFFRKLNYLPAHHFTDYLLDEEAAAPEHTECIGPVPFLSLPADELRDEDPEICWERSYPCLESVKESLGVIAFASPRKVEAFLVFKEEAAHVLVKRCYSLDPAAKPMFFAMLSRYLRSELGKPLFFSKVSDAELSGEVVSRLGFRKGQSYVRLATKAKAG